MSTPELAAVDQLLAAWDERLRRVDDNLLALEGDSTYQTLCGLAGRRAKLDGVTRERVAPALDALQELFDQRAKLTAILDRAKEVRTSISSLTFWSSDEKVAEIQKLLSGPSIVLGARLVPLAHRNLLDAAALDVAVSPEQLLAAMVRAYEVARDAVTAVGRAWTALQPRLEQAARDIASVRTSARNELSPADHDELAVVERELAALEIHVATDPLGASGNIDGTLRPRIDAVAARVAAQGATRERVATALAHAVDLQQTLASQHVAAVRALERTPREFSEPTANASQKPQVVDDALLAGLGPWLARLQATAKAGRWSSAEVGLARWTETAESYLASDRVVVDAFETLASTRAEMLGRLSARRAQAEALAARGLALDADLAALARQAETLLQQRPTPLDEAKALLERYESEVVRCARGR